MKIEAKNVLFGLHPNTGSRVSSHYFTAIKFYFECAPPKNWLKYTTWQIVRNDRNSKREKVFIDQ